MKSIVMLIDYFGTWPGWMPVFLASCKYNDSIDWIIRTDCDIPLNAPPNVRFVRMEYREYLSNVSRKLEVNFSPIGNYKICDLKPMYGDMYIDEIEDYDYYGFGDLDVIYGNIRKFYTDDVLSNDVISTHVDMISGHFALFRNVEYLRKAYKRIPRWKNYIEDENPTRFDEDIYSCLYVPRNTFAFGKVPVNLARGLSECDQIPRINVYFKEQYSTVFHPMRWHDGCEEHPEAWFWKNGVVTNDRNFDREYLYLHLMNFQSMRWVNSTCRENRTPWKDNPAVQFILPGEESGGVRIDWSGIHGLEPS